MLWFFFYLIIHKHPKQRSEILNILDVGKLLDTTFKSNSFPSKKEFKSVFPWFYFCNII